VPRLYLHVVLVLAATFGVARAQPNDAPPTPAQIEQAKKAFGEGKKLHDAGKLPEAIEKFKESYRLSKNPLLLYNIGLTMEEAGMDDLALFYYRKFVKDAPQDAAQRATVNERVAVLEKKFASGAPAPSEPAKPAEPAPVAKAPVPAAAATKQIKPAGTYSATDFQHEPVESAPPGKPLDVTAFVPEDSGFVVTLYFRTAGEGKFTAKVMRWRYKELVGRVPAPKMLGSSVQYYIEAKDTAGNVVARSGKATSPNLINLEKDATQRFYPDFNDDGGGEKLSATEINERDVEDDDPLSKKKKKNKPKKETAQAPTDDGGMTHPDNAMPGNGFRDVGSSKFKYAKWGSSIAGGTFLGLGIFSFVQARAYARALEDDAAKTGQTPHTYDDYARGVEKTGKRYQTIERVSLGLAAVSGVVAGYYWYKEMTAKKRGELKVSKNGSPGSTWVVAPAAGDSFVGAAAAARF
jgi:tetratricopeptide (TPR) repeat protein